MPTERSELGQLLRDLREARGLTQLEAAARAGVPNTNLSKYERGKVEPDVKVLDRILKSYGVSLVEALRAAAQVGGGKGDVAAGATGALEGDLTRQLGLEDKEWEKELEELDKPLTDAEVHEGLKAFTAMI